ncbi:hypothetical protein K490DRAFT_62040 [Saccharata proteae CBS 121410]|uniref:Fe2OG dioxygenase domain-containing protein n=1 Tax=Saccharata proteae CBS 121410 TaxID=1314787 RepID=A0A9P4LYW2_9PEZI|nr:hypothetical protein K490DRAFT_62040 [Saccharata proteae CBS 121410]
MTTTPIKKRKTLHDYFVSSESSSANRPPKQRQTQQTQQRQQTDIPGLSLAPGFVTAAEEASLLAFLDTQTWRTDLSRRTMHYGGTYCLMPPKNASPAERAAIERNIIAAPALPAELDFLIDRMVAKELYRADARPGFCIVNEYLPGSGISAHVENFRFGEPVCSLTLGHGDHMRFHELSSPHDGSVRSRNAATAPRTGRRRDVWLAPRSLVVLRGDARERWQHEIVRGQAKGRSGPGWRRVSLTFRVEKRRTT